MSYLEIALENDLRLKGNLNLQVPIAETKPLGISK